MGRTVVHTEILAATYNCGTYGTSTYDEQCDTSPVIGVPNTGAGQYMKALEAGDPWAVTSLVCGVILIVTALTILVRNLMSRKRP